MFIFLDSLSWPVDSSLSCFFVTTVLQLLCCCLSPLHFRTMVMKIIGSALPWVSPCLCMMLSFKSVGAPFSLAGEADLNILQLLNVFVPGSWEGPMAVIPLILQQLCEVGIIVLFYTGKLRHAKMKGIWSNRGNALSGMRTVTLLLPTCCAWLRKVSLVCSNLMKVTSHWQWDTPSMQRAQAPSSLSVVVVLKHRAAIHFIKNAL